MKIHGSRRVSYLLLAGVTSLALFLGLLSLTASLAVSARAQSRAPIPPPAGYPKLSLSTKTVSPTLANSGGVSLTYSIEIRNTGATTATGVSLSDPLPGSVTYNGDAWASHGQAPALISSTLVWTGEVGFDATVVLTFSVSVDPAFTGTLVNSAVISDANIARPVTVSAETVVTDEPILSIAKTSSPAMPGPGKTLFYQLQVSNWGQPLVDQPITVTDRVPFSTTLRDVGPDGVDGGDRVTWTRQLSLALGESTYFSFSVDVDADALSGTVIANELYAVQSPASVAAGELYTVTLIDPIFLLSKSVWPDPPGSNREMTYTLSLVNVGSLATGLVITDVIPGGVEYRRGGSADLPVVRWTWDELDSGELARFTYTVYISDIMDVPIVNDQYRVECDEGAFAWGKVLTSVVQGPKFEVSGNFDPPVKGPGGGNKLVTPTLFVRNLGPGNALDAYVHLFFGNLSVSANDLYVDPDGALPWDPAALPLDCGDYKHCYAWVGDLGYGKQITFTTSEGQSTIGGDEGTNYTATVVVTDNLITRTTTPLTYSLVGTVTHLANLVPTKSAPEVIGRGQLMTYTIQVRNSAMSTDEPPTPWLWDVVPLSATVESISDGGQIFEISSTLRTTVISWTLPGMSTGEILYRSYSVRVDNDLVSGTRIVNDDYRVYWYEDDATFTGIVSRTGRPVTTTVMDIGLVDSFKTVTPQLSSPGPDNILTYEIHLVNSSGVTLNNVSAHDMLPWTASTYQRDAVASAGAIVSDIVSLDWQGSINAYSEVVVTATVLVDTDFEGVLTNTVVISQPDLLAPVVRHALAYVTANPVLLINKNATPDPVRLDGLLTYRLRVRNLGQQATALLITDLLPLNLTYVPTGGGKLVSNTVRWEWPVLETNEQVEFSFMVRVDSGAQVENALYGVNCAEGVLAMGDLLVTDIARKGAEVFLPLVLKLAP